MPFNKTGSTYFGFDTSSSGSVVPHAVNTVDPSADKLLHKQPVLEDAEEDAVDAKASKTNGGGQKKSTPSSSKDDSRDESDCKW